VDEENLGIARTPVALHYRYHSLVISAQTSKQCRKYSRQNPQVPKKYAIAHSTLNNKCWKCLAGDALHTARTYPQAGPLWALQADKLHPTLYKKEDLNLTLVCVLTLRCLSLTQIRQESRRRDNLPETKHMYSSN
jgi:hypothetical protein